jgi:hypothetical protein
MEVRADTPGSLTISFKSKQPMSGQVLLATAQIRGTVTFLAGWLRNEKGLTETPAVSITNPTEEQLSAKESRRPAAVSPVAAGPGARPQAKGAPAAVNASAEPKAVVLLPEAASRTITFSCRKSVLELFRAYSGERTPAALARLFERIDGTFLQEPMVLLSDGSASLRFTFRESVPSKRAPRFYISGGSCTGLMIGDDGSWMLEIVPERGSLATSVTVLTGEEMIEFPLAVAPPLELFDIAEPDERVAEYVAVANLLAPGEHAAELGRSSRLQ